MSALASLFVAVRLNRRSVRAVAAVAAVVLLGLAGFAPGCKKQSESLILVSMQVNDDNGAGVSAAEIRVNEESPSTALVISRVFDLPTGLSKDNAYEVGIYVPAGAIGVLPVSAIARPAQGCNGYFGSRTAKVDGGDTTPVLLTMRATNVCTLAGTAGAGGTTGVGGAAGGTAGTSGTTGTAGRGGTTGTGGSGVSNCGSGPGTPPAAVGPPSLVNCAEVDHNPVGAVCDPSINDFNPYVNNLAVSPDGQLLATAGGDSLDPPNGSVKIWRFQGATPVPCGPVINGVGIGPPFIAFSPNGRQLAVAWNGAYVEIYNVPNFTFAAEIRSSISYLYGVGWSPDSQTVFSMDWDLGTNGTLYADRPDGTALSSLRLNVDPDALTVSPVATGGVTNIAVAGADGNAGLYTWNGSTLSGPTILTTAPMSLGWGIRFSPNGQLLAVGGSDGQVRFFGIPATSTTPMGTSINVGSNNTVYGLAFSPGSDFIALAFGMQAEIWNVSTRVFVSRRTLTPPPGSTATYADSVSFSASGGALIVGEDVCGKVLVCSD